MNGDGDDDSWLTGWEQQCANSIDEQPDYEQSLRTENDSSHRKVWAGFQDSATAIAQLYRDRFTCEPGALWVPFQTAAGTVTSLYKESCDGIRRTSEVALQCGYQRRNRELLLWAKRKRPHIRRDDLLAYLSGKPPPPSSHHHHHSHLHHLPLHHRSSPRPRTPPGVAQASPGTDNSDLHPAEDPETLDTFREALAMSPLSRRPRGPELCAFITGEIARHCTKRPASPSDVTMGSPTHHQQKRQRFISSRKINNASLLNSCLTPLMNMCEFEHESNVSEALQLQRIVFRGNWHQRCIRPSCLFPSSGRRARQVD